MGFAHGFETERCSRLRPALRFTKAKQKFAEQFAVFTIDTVERDHRARRNLPH